MLSKAERDTIRRLLDNGFLPPYSVDVLSLSKACDHIAALEAQLAITNRIEPELSRFRHGARIAQQLRSLFTAQRDERIRILELQLGAAHLRLSTMGLGDAKEGEGK